MKFASPLALLAAISGVQSLAIERSESELVRVVTNVLDGALDLESAAQSYNGADIQPIADAADRLINTIYNGQEVAYRAESLSLLGAWNLLPPVEKLEDAANDLYGTFSSRRGEVARARQCGLTRQKLGIIASNGNRLIDIIYNKVPSVAHGIAQPHTDNIKGILTKAQALFSEGNCVDAW